MLNQGTAIESRVLHASDDELISEVKAVLGIERRALVRFLSILASIDTRQIYVEAGYASLFTFLTHALHLSEGSAAKRVRACRLIQQHPQMLALVESGAIHLSAASLLFAHKDDDRFAELLRESAFKSARAIEFMLAKAFPKSVPVRESLRLIVPRKEDSTVMPPKPPMENEIPSASLSAPKSNFFDAEPTSATPPAIIPGEKSTEVSARLSITLSQADYLRLKRMQELMPGISLGEVIGKALECLQEKTDPAVRLDQGKRPRNVKSDETTEAKKIDSDMQTKASSRYISTAIKREVLSRDGNQCTYVAADGHQCAERGKLEFDHIVPFAQRGSNEAENLRLRCKAHNLHHARSIFGEEFMQAKMAHSLS